MPVPLRTLLCFVLFHTLYTPFGDSSICNYIYDENNARAYPTDVCLELYSNTFVKYQCLNNSLKMQSFAEETCDTKTLIHELNLNELISAQNMSVQYEFYCGGTDRCYIEMMDTCGQNGDETKYYPLKQCLNGNGSISFQYDCDPISSTIYYFEYDGMDCDPSHFNEEKSLLDIGTHSCSEYVDCRSTPYPTTSPSLHPSALPTVMPSEIPTFHFPYRDVIERVQNSSSENSSSSHTISFLFVIAVVHVLR